MKAYWQVLNGRPRVSGTKGLGNMYHIQSYNVLILYSILGGLYSLRQRFKRWRLAQTIGVDFGAAARHAPPRIIEKRPCIYHFSPPLATQYFGLPTQYFWQVYASGPNAAEYISIHTVWFRCMALNGGTVVTGHFMSSAASSETNQHCAMY